MQAGVCDGPLSGQTLGGEDRLNFPPRLQPGKEENQQRSEGRCGLHPGGVADDERFHDEPAKDNHPSSDRYAAGEVQAGEDKDRGGEEAPRDYDIRRIWLDGAAFSANTYLGTSRRVPDTHGLVRVVRDANAAGGRRRPAFLRIDACLRGPVRGDRTFRARQWRPSDCPVSAVSLARERGVAHRVSPG